ncbi:amino acid adenylation domain-containing protein [Dactylosporangium vinaceum]|uniref:Non-ribosomal peptide synthetase n=1 Tax=Dactylosporangium vinaceum TaxID=53362 RepID=A0ABV5MSV8_9ACTN|nr:non-ribosomal peptide synthetase [Dactylosporangium vinaceum]UAB97679.1 amino acid adenylation domain-containing protein [Dactylosporangium vinaceum]
MTTLSADRRALLERRLKGRATNAVPAHDGPAPLSFAQERFWFLEQLAPGNTAAVIPIVMRLHGALDAERLAAAITGVVARHEPLHSRFVDAGDGKPQLCIDPPGPVALPTIPRAGLEAFLAEPFDLATGPLIRPALVALAADDHLLAIAVHHIATDGWSMDRFAAEVTALYAGEALPPLPVRYRDFAAWQRANTGLGADVEFWRTTLAGVEPLDLPTDHPRPARQTFNGAEHSFAVGLRDELHALARDNGVTLHMVLLAAFQAVLGRLTGQTEFAVGSPVAGRQRPELEKLIGMFVNTVPVRAPLGGDPTFAELLGRVKDVCLDGYQHQDLPFEQLVQELKVPRDVRRSPVFQALFALQNYDEHEGRTATGKDLGGLTLGHWPAPVCATRFELELYVKEASGELWATVVHNTDLFAPDTAIRLAGHFRRFLAAVVADPRQRLSDVDLLDPQEQAVVLPPPEPIDLPPTTVPALIAARMAAQPGAVAVTFGGKHLTYGELDERSARLAARIPRGSLVAVTAQRSFDLVVALLAILRAGAAYVPLDPEYPAERLEFMRADCGARPLEELTAEGDGFTGPGLDDIAYVIYTSGSTGRPKGVPNTHRALLNRLDWMQRRFGLGPGDAVLQKTPAGFDVSVWEFFWPLMAGARLVLAAPGGHRDAEYLRDLIRAEQVTTVHFVPSMLAVFLATEDVADCTSLRTIVCSGEALPADLARRCLATFRAGHPVSLHNLYGPTEAAIDVSAWHCDGDALAGLARVPIGAPIQNVALYVLDDHLRPAPVGVPGQLFIAGIALARGYHRRPALTAEKFRPDPYGPPGARMYATGDRARRRPDGTIDFLGRLDTQVKLRGLRIELGEVEAAIRSAPAVQDAAVVVLDDRLVGYVVGADPGLDLRALLQKTLPDYMVPSAFVPLDALPLTPNGKLDRGALPAPTVTRRAGVEFVEPATDAERIVAGVWQELLPVERVGAADDFFDLGGHSLIATQVVARLRRHGAAVSVLDVFQYKTVRELARLLSPDADRGPRRLLYELTKPQPPQVRVGSIVAVPYGGGSAVVYQPLADALPAGWALHAVAIPGQDIGVREEALPFEELATRLTAEVLERVEGPLIVYGHCGVGSSVAVELARRLEAAGRTVDAVYIGAVFPFARPTGRFSGLLARLAGREALLSNRVYENWLRSMGVEMAEFDRDEADLIIRNMREHTRLAEEYFTGLFASQAAPIRAPIVSVVGSQDTQTEFYQERYREWHFLTGDTALVVLDEAGHFFLKYRAEELSRIVTEVHRTGEQVRDPDGGWEVAARSSTLERIDGPEPSLGRFMAVAAGQLVSIIGSALTEFALPLWIYLQTGSLVRFAVFAVLGLVPGMLVAPFAGAVVDRFDRRKVMLAGDLGAGASQAVLLALALAGSLRVGHVYVLLVVLSVALTFQRLAFSSAVPQLVPKRYLGHANGMVQLSFGAGQFLVPLVAAGLMATVGLRGVLLLDVVSYVAAVGVTLAVRFPKTLAWARRESFWQEVVGGWRYALGAGGLRPVLVFFAVLNLFMTPLFLLISPLVLSFADLGAVARVSMAGGLGAVAGGLLMSFWGGPRRHRVRGMLLVVLGLALCSALPGLRPSEILVAAGALGMSLGLTLANGVYTTIVQVKVPQRFHGRVFAVNTVIAFSTIPIGYAVVAPLGSRLLDPLLAPGGALADSVGALIGTGPGRGTALLFLVLAAVMVGQVLVSLRLPSLARFDERVPDAAPDDLIGAQVRRARKEQSQ